MKPWAYYNENDADKCAWLRELIKSKVITDGEVDEREIQNVGPDDLTGFRRCHFFAGIGVWDYALNLAKWGERFVWTGSCPCPSFSGAGKGGGFDDPRHLWPDWARLIRKCKPATVFGEQVDDAIGHGWLDLIQTDLERENYAVGKAVLGACSVGAPHIRQRLYFVAHATGARYGRSQDRGAIPEGEVARPRSSEPERFCGDGRLAHADSERCGEARVRGGQPSERISDAREHGELADSDRGGQSMCGEPNSQHDGELRSGTMRRMGNADSAASHELSGKVPRSKAQSGSQWFGDGHQRDGHSGSGFVNGFWRDADWVLRKRWNSEDWEWCPTESRIIALSARTASHFLPVCGESEERKEENIDATTHQERPDQVLFGMRSSDETSTIQRNARIESGVSEKEVLQPEVHGREIPEGILCEPQPQPKQGPSQPQRKVRNLREESDSRSPQGPEPTKQHRIELAEFVRLLPSSLALAELSGDTATTEAVQALLETCGATGLMQYTPDAIEAAWRSTSDESKNRLQVCLDQGGFVMAGTFPLAAGVKNRVLKLRGYGDAICAPTAQAFIRAYMACVA